METIKHIAVVSPRFPEGATVGGAETLLRTLAGYARDAGLRVTCLTTCARNHFSWANELPAGTRTLDGMEVQFFPVNEDRDIEAFLAIQTRIDSRRNLTPEEEWIWLDNSVNSRALVDDLRRRVATFDRIVVGPYLFGITDAVSRIAPEKTVLVPCLHDEPFAYLAAMRDLFARCRTAAFNSTAERDLAVRLFGQGFAEQPVVGMGFSTADSHHPQRFIERHRLTAPYIIYCGRRETLKGTPLLLDYLNLFRKRTGRDVKLVTTGVGAIHPPEALAPHVLDLGFVGEQEKRDAMAGAVAFCHPSVNESFGIVIMESFLAGTPALVHAKGHVLQRLCLDSGGGLWFRHYPDFEQELMLLLDSPDIRNGLGNSGRAFVQAHYSHAAVSEKWLRSLMR